MIAKVHQGEGIKRKKRRKIDKLVPLSEDIMCYLTKYLFAVVNKIHASYRSCLMWNSTMLFIRLNSWKCLWLKSNHSFLWLYECLYLSLFSSTFRNLTCIDLIVINFEHNRSHFSIRNVFYQCQMKM